MACDSTRGEWSTPTRESRCPDCNAVMPVDKGPMTTWMADRNRDARQVTTRAADRPQYQEFQIKRGPRVKTPPNVPSVLTERQQEIVRIVEKHGGNRNAAARELGVTGPSVITTLNKLRRRGVPVPEPARKVAS
jgi:DNA-binding CsgD family transcriptional regulator